MRLQSVGCKKMKCVVYRATHTHVVHGPDTATDTAPLQTKFGMHRPSGSNSGCPQFIAIRAIRRIRHLGILFWQNSIICRLLSEVSFRIYSNARGKSFELVSYTPYVACPFPCCFLP